MFVSGSEGQGEDFTRRAAWKRLEYNLDLIQCLFQVRRARAKISPGGRLGNG